MKNKIAIKVSDKYQSEAVEGMATDAGWEKKTKSEFFRYPMYFSFPSNLCRFPDYWWDTSDYYRKLGYTILDYLPDYDKIREFFAKPEVCLACGSELDSAHGTAFPDCPNKIPEVCGECGGKMDSDCEHKCPLEYHPPPKKVPFESIDGIGHVDLRWEHDGLKLRHGSLPDGVFTPKMIRESCCYFGGKHVENLTMPEVFDLAKEFLTPAEIEKLFYDKCVGDGAVGKESVGISLTVWPGENYGVYIKDRDRAESYIGSGEVVWLRDYLNRWIKQHGVKK